VSRPFEFILFHAFLKNTAADFIPKQYFNFIALAIAKRKEGWCKGRELLIKQNWTALV
jgi:hypothetical protein